MGVFSVTSVALVNAVKGVRNSVLFFLNCGFGFRYT